MAFYPGSEQYMRATATNANHRPTMKKKQNSKQEATQPKNLSVAVLEEMANSLLTEAKSRLEAAGKELHHYQTRLMNVHKAEESEWISLELIISKYSSVTEQMTEVCATK